MPTPAGKGLGRLHAPDARDRSFLLSAHPAAQKIQRVTSRSWGFHARPIDQGNTGTCVGHAWKHCLMADPIVRRTADKPSAFDIYDAAVKIDEFSDNDNDTARQMGTSVRGGAKVLQGLGLLTEYSWVTSADEAARWIGGQNERGEFVGGPVVIGVNWYTSMFDTDREGLLRIAGSVAGGHSVCINKLYQKLGLFGGIQSWSLPWGVFGHFLISGEDLDRLLKEDGEGCTPTESRTRI